MHVIIIYHGSFQIKQNIIVQTQKKYFSYSLDPYLVTPCFCDIPNPTICMVPRLIIDS